MNMDQDTRDAIIAPFTTDGMGTPDRTYVRYEGLTPEALKELVDQGFADRGEAQNDAPELGSLLDYALENKSITFSGYTIGKPRNDYRVTVDKIVLSDKSDKDATIRFALRFHSADELSDHNGALSAWWD